MQDISRWSSQCVTEYNLTVMEEYLVDAKVKEMIDQAPMYLNLTIIQIPASQHSRTIQ